MNITPVNGSSFNLDYYSKNQIKIDSDNEIINYRNLSNEEAKNLYYTSQVSNIMKSKMETSINLDKKENRSDRIEHYKEASLHRDNLKYIGWA